MGQRKREIKEYFETNENGNNIPNFGDAAKAKTKTLVLRRKFIAVNIYLKKKEKDLE